MKLDPRADENSVLVYLTGRHPGETPVFLAINLGWTLHRTAQTLRRLRKAGLVRRVPSWRDHRLMQRPCSYVWVYRVAE